MEVITEQMDDTDIRTVPLPDPENATSDQAPQSIENLPCTDLHEPGEYRALPVSLA